MCYKDTFLFSKGEKNGQNVPLKGAFYSQSNLIRWLDIFQGATCTVPRLESPECLVRQVQDLEGFMSSLFKREPGLLVQSLT